MTKTILFEEFKSTGTSICVCFSACCLAFFFFFEFFNSSIFNPIKMASPTDNDDKIPKLLQFWVLLRAGENKSDHLSV